MAACSSVIVCGGWDQSRVIAPVLLDRAPGDDLKVGDLLGFDISHLLSVALVRCTPTGTAACEPPSARPLSSVRGNSYRIRAVDFRTVTDLRLPEEPVHPALVSREDRAPRVLLGQPKGPSHHAALGLGRAPRPRPEAVATPLVEPRKPAPLSGRGLHQPSVRQEGCSQPERALRRLPREARVAKAWSSRPSGFSPTTRTLG
jgi:hypothetical protein